MLRRNRGAQRMRQSWSSACWRARRAAERPLIVIGVGAVITRRAIVDGERLRSDARAEQEFPCIMAKVQGANQLGVPGGPVSMQDIQNVQRELSQLRVL